MTVPSSNPFLQDGLFKVRRVISSMDARAAKFACNIVKDPKSLVDDFNVADVTFIVVNSWHPEFMTKEGQLTKEVMGVAKEAGVKHVISSALVNAESGSNQQFGIPHFTLKAQAFDFLKRTCRLLLEPVDFDETC